MKFALFVPFNIEPLSNNSGIFLRSPFIYLRWLGFHYRRNCGGIYSFQLAITNSLRLQGIPNLIRAKIIKSLLISLDMGITIEDHNLEIISSHYISWSINTKSDIQVSMGAGSIRNSMNTNMRPIAGLKLFRATLLASRLNYITLKSPPTFNTKAFFATEAI